MGLKTLICVMLLVGITIQQSLYGPDSKIVKLTSANFEKRVLKSKQMWFVEFYAPWCGHCKNLAPAWEKLAGTFQGIIGVGAVDMTTDQAVGQPYNVQGFPTLKFFGVDKTKPIDYNGGRTAEEMAKFAMAQLRTVVSDRLKGKKTTGGAYSQSGRPSGSYKEKAAPGGGSDKDVVVLTDANFDELVMQSEDTWLVEFYAPWCGHCKKLEPEWNEAATKLLGEVKVGKVDATVHTKLGSRFKVEGYPTIKLFPGGKKRDSSAEPYNGARDASSIVAYALEKKEQTKPVLKVEQLVNSEIYNTYCNPKARGVCLVAFIPHILDSSPKQRQEYISVLEEVSANNKGKPITFLWSQGGDQFDMEEAFSLGSGYPSVIAISNSKKKYGVMRAAFSKSSVESFITGLMTGKEVLYNLVKEVPIKKVPRWDGSAGKTVDSESGKPTDEL